MKQAPSFHITVSHARQKGAVALELAMILPALIFLLVGVADLGSLLRDHQVLETAAREGARFSSLPGNQGATDAVRQRVNDYLAANGIPIASGNVSIDVNQAYPLTIAATGAAQGFPSTPALRVSATRVVVTYTRPLLIPADAILPSGDFTLNATVVFRNFYYIELP